MSTALQLQKDTAAFLDTHADFAGIPIVREFADVNAGDALLDDYVAMHLKGGIVKGGKCGLVVILSTPVGEVVAPNSPGPVEDLTFSVYCLENIALNKAANGTGIRADEIAETIKKLLHLWCHDGTHEVQFVSSEQDREEERQSKHLRGWILVFKSAAHAVQPRDACATPAISIATHTATITTATSGATILYSLDGSFPSLAYSAPVNISGHSGATLRAIAKKTNLRTSDCAFKSL